MNASILQDRELLMKSLGHAGHLVNNRLDAALAPYGLSIAKLGVLRVLTLAEEPLPLSQVAESLACVRSNITQLVDRLEADGLVQREADAEDRRSKRASVTAEGRRLYFVGAAVEVQVEQELFSGLSPEECEQLRKILTRLSAGRVTEMKV